MHPVPAPAQLRPTALYLVKQLELAIRARLDDVLRSSAVTPLQYTALTVLERRSDLTTAELARSSFVTDQSAADMVVVLERRGLITRHADPADRRRRVIRLTDAAHELLADVRPAVAEVEAQMLAPLGTDVDAFLAGLAACHHALVRPVDPG